MTALQGALPGQGCLADGVFVLGSRRRNLGPVPRDVVVAQPPGQGAEHRCRMVIAVPCGIEPDVQRAPRADDVQLLQTKTWIWVTSSATVIEPRAAQSCSGRT